MDIVAAIICWILLAAFHGKLGSYNEITDPVGFSVLIFSLFGGLFYLLSGDGLIKRIWNRNKLSPEEKEVLRFLRSFDLGRYYFTIMTLAKGMHKPCTDDDWQHLRRYKGIKEEVIKGASPYSRICQRMLKARIWLIEQSRDLKEALDWLE